jgi:hypothetical protein
MPQEPSSSQSALINGQYTSAGRNSTASSNAQTSMISRVPTTPTIAEAALSPSFRPKEVIFRHETAPLVQSWRLRPLLVHLINHGPLPTSYCICW